MRCSIVLALLAIMENVVYGFSQRPSSSSSSSLLLSGPRIQSMVPSSSLTQQMQLPPYRSKTHNAHVILRGGGGVKVYATTPSSDNTASSSTSGGGGGSKSPVTGTGAILASLWGTTGVLYILAKAIKRVLPIALEPFQGTAPALSQFELGSYIVMCLWFAYVEGYKGFQLKFSPLVVKRSFTLIPGKNGTNWLHFVLAPLYSMGLIHATKKRQIVSWSVTIGVAAIVAAVKRLPYPWRNIVDAGVVVGLTWGSLSIALNYIKSWVTGSPPSQVDAELPESARGES